MEEVVAGRVSTYFAQIGVAAIEVSKTIKVGDKLYFKGHTTDFDQVVESIEIEHEQVEEAKAGDSIGIKVKDRVRPHDVVYRVTE